MYANACTVDLAYKNSLKPIVIDLPKRVWVLLANWIYM